PLPDVIEEALGCAVLEIVEALLVAFARHPDAGLAELGGVEERRRRSPAAALCLSVPERDQDVAAPDDVATGRLVADGDLLLRPRTSQHTLRDCPGAVGVEDGAVVLVEVLGGGVVGVVER